MNDLDQAIGIIKEGGIVIFPTDTAFGIGCRVDNKDSIDRLYEIRRRSHDKPMPVLFDSITRVKDYLLPFNYKVEKLMKDYWPGALTLELLCDMSKIAPNVNGGRKTLGTRIPDHELARDLIKGSDVPIVGTSANFAGEKTPFSLEGLDKSLIKLVDFVLEGKTRGINKTSTVIDCSKDPWEIIRQGDVMPDL